MSKKIMIVDDEEDILFTVGKMLELDGYKVIRCNNGKECLNELEEELPDLVLLDIMMPEINGWDLAAKIKENPEWKQIPIIFLTAKGDTMSVGMGGLAADDYIVKPFNVKELKERIAQVLNSK
jgi:DNA-binding response OmpR family regulator